MGRQWNAIIDALSGGTMSINANLTDIEALLTTLQADVADGITVSSGTVTAKVLAGNTEAIVAKPIAVGADAEDFNSGSGRVAVDLVNNLGYSIVQGGLLPISGTVTANATKATTGGTGSTDFTSTSYGTIATASTGRLGCTIYNTGPGNLYVLLGTATASTSNFTARLSSGDYYEVPFNYTGLIGGIFATAGTAEVTQLS
jgi:hypothetical protein